MQHRQISLPYENWSASGHKRIAMKSTALAVSDWQRPSGASTRRKTANSVPTLGYLVVDHRSPFRKCLAMTMTADGSDIFPRSDFFSVRPTRWSKRLVERSGIDRMLARSGG
jgi:hypothetical protein